MGEMKEVKRIGPSTDPCGTPVLSRTDEEMSWPTSHIETAGLDRTEASSEQFHQHHTSSEVDRVGSHDLWCRRQRSGQVKPGAWIPPGRQKVWFC